MSQAFLETVETDLAAIVPYPSHCEIEGVQVAGFPNAQSLFERVLLEIRKPQQTLIHYLNIHVANTALFNPQLKQSLQNASLVYCDGAGIQVAAKMLGGSMPIRLPAADWFIDLIAYMARQNVRVFLLGGQPGVPEGAMEVINREVPEHTVVGSHHGFFLNQPELERQVIEQINALKPDLLIVGFGTPLQERWMAQNRDRLNVSTLYGLGAILDYISGRIRRCPDWMGNAGMEWLYRFLLEPRRMVGRYIIGNPWFLSRIAIQCMLAKIGSTLKVRPA